jgi:hypothetical protein
MIYARHDCENSFSSNVSVKRDNRNKAKLLGEVSCCLGILKRTPYMADIFPFRPYRYTDAAGPLADLVTQPYDKISPEVRARHSFSPYNLVRIISERSCPTVPRLMLHARSQTPERRDRPRMRS